MLKVLVVDDNPDERKQAIRTVRKLFGDKAEITEHQSFSSNDDIKKYFEEQKFDLVITDYHMMVTGDAVAYYARESQRNKDALVIGRSTDNHEKVMMRAGTHKFCFKPWRTEADDIELEMAIKKLFPTIVNETSPSALSEDQRTKS